MKTLLLILGLLVCTTIAAQDMSYGPLYAQGKNEQGYPIFMLRCTPWKCLGPQHKDYGPPEAIVRYTPAIPAKVIDDNGYHCYKLCWDREGNLVGHPSPDWRDPYLK